MEAAEAAAASPREGRRRPSLRPSTGPPLSIVFAAAEVAPWSKTGGLADVMAALPKALAARGHRVMVVTARHTNGGADEARYSKLSLLRPICGGGGGEDGGGGGGGAGGGSSGTARDALRVQIGGAEQEVKFYHQRSDGVDWVFVDHPVFQRPGTPYGDASGPFRDNLFRFALLSLAALEAPLVLPLGPLVDGAGEGVAAAAAPQAAAAASAASPRPVAAASSSPSSSSSSSSAAAPYGDDVVFVANDYHTALVPALLSARYKPGGAHQRARSVLCIHNLGHQGEFDASDFNGLGLPGGLYSLLEWRPPPVPAGQKRADGSGGGHEDREEDSGKRLNLLKAGLETAGALVTVSPAYAAEIASRRQRNGVDALISRRAASLYGVVNGVDGDEWSPETDPHIATRFSADNLAGARTGTNGRTKEWG